MTGGVGFIGSHLARRLVGGGQFVRVVDNLATGNRRNLEDVIMDLVALVEEVGGRRITVRHAHERAGDVRDSQASLDRGGAVLGYAPRVTVRAGIERLSSRGISRIPAA